MSRIRPRPCRECSEILNLTNENHTYITITEDESGDDIEYVVSTNGARVTRNGSSITLRELADGDEVTLILDYGKVSRITASSTSGTARGTIKEIILSDAPKITMEIEGKEYTYSMTTNTEVTVNGVAGTIYDLRPNNSADIVIDGTTRDLYRHERDLVVRQDDDRGQSHRNKYEYIRHICGKFKRRNRHRIL